MPRIGFIPIRGIPSRYFIYPQFPSTCFILSPIPIPPYLIPFHSISHLYLQYISSLTQFNFLLTVLSFRDDPSISLNFEDVRDLSNLILHRYHNWVHNAPPTWNTDSFLKSNSPILITSRYGQNASIALPHNSSNEADAWNKERDYSKVAFLTFALATSIEYIISFIYHFKSSSPHPSFQMLSYTRLGSHPHIPIKR